MTDEPQVIQWGHGTLAAEFSLAVGLREASRSSFPGPRGLHEVLDRIRDRGKVPGLWLEPEVVGVRGTVADALPGEAFFRRDGMRVVEAGRYHLDLRHPAARAHLDGVLDRHPHLVVDNCASGGMRIPAAPAGRGRPGRPALPGAGRAVSAWHPDTAELTLTMLTVPSAVLLRLRRAESNVE